MGWARGMITNHDELKAAVAEWLARPGLGERVPAFIALAEARLNRRLRTAEMETRARAETTPGEPWLALPSAFGGLRAMTIVSTSPPRPLPLQTPQQAAGLAGLGTPGGYCIIDGAFRLAPAPDAVYTIEIVYYRKVPA